MVLIRGRPRPKTSDLLRKFSIFWEEKLWFFPVRFFSQQKFVTLEKSNFKKKFTTQDFGNVSGLLFCKCEEILKMKRRAKEEEESLSPIHQLHS
jgi:hypothetical protein